MSNYTESVHGTRKYRDDASEPSFHRQIGENFTECTSIGRPYSVMPYKKKKKSPRN